MPEVRFGSTGLNDVAAIRTSACFDSRGGVQAQTSRKRRADDKGGHRARCAGNIRRNLLAYAVVGDEGFVFDEDQLLYTLTDAESA